jgi:hypothetical protein
MMLYLIQQILALPLSPLAVSTVLLVLSPVLALVFRIRRVKKMAVARFSCVSFISGALLSPAAICQIYWSARVEPYSPTSISFPVAIALLCAVWQMLLFGVGLLSLAMVAPARANPGADFSRDIGSTATRKGTG